MEVTIQMNVLTLENNSIKNKFFALILALVMFVGVMAPKTAYADEAAKPKDSAGGVGALNVEFGEDGAKLKGGGFSTATDNQGVWGQILTRFHTQISAVFGIFMLVALFKFGQLLTKLIMSSDNPRERSETITGLIIAGIATAALGAATLLFGFFYHLLL